MGPNTHDVDRLFKHRPQRRICEEHRLHFFAAGSVPHSLRDVASMLGLCLCSTNKERHTLSYCFPADSPSLCREFEAKSQLAVPFVGQDKNTSSYCVFGAGVLIYHVVLRALDLAFKARRFARRQDGAENVVHSGDSVVVPGPSERVVHYAARRPRRRIRRPPVELHNVVWHSQQVAASGPVVGNHERGRCQPQTICFRERTERGVVGVLAPPVYTPPKQ